MASSASSSRAAPHHEKVFIDDLALSDLTDAQQRQLASLAPRKASQRIQRTNSRHAHELVLERVDDPADASLVVCATFHPGAEGFQNYIQWRQRCPTAKFCRVQYLARLIDHKKWIPPPHWAAIGGGGAGDVLPKYHSLIDLILPTSDDDSVRPFILASASDERTQAKHLVMLLGGRPLMDTDMDADVGSATHLVCNSVMMPPAAGAEVYAGARERGLPIVSSGWLEDMVKKECYLPDISPYRLPPFKGLSIAILPSAIRNQQTRRECERAITDNGGRVLDKLSPNDLASRVSCVVVDCTDNPILEALRHPRHSHLRTVGVRWVKASVEAGYPMSYDGEGMGVAEPAWKRYQEDAEVMIPTDDQECGTWLISTVVCLTHLPPAVQHYHKILVHKGGGMLAFGYDDPAITHVLVDPSQPSNSLPSTLTAGSTGLLPPYFVTPSWLDTSNDQKQAADVGLFAAKVDRGRSVPQPPATPSQPPAPFFMLTNGNAGAPPPAPAFPQNHPAPPPSLSRQPTDMNDGGQPDAPLAPPAPFPFPPPVPPLTNPSNNHNANRNRKRKNDTRQKPPTRGWGQQNDSRYKKLDVFSQRNTGNQPQPPPPPPGPPPQRSAAPHPSRRPPALPPLNLRVKQETGQPAAAAAAVPPPAFEPIVHVKREDESEMGQEDAYSMHAEAAAGMQEGYEGYADQGGMGEGAVEGEGEMAAADGDGGGVGEDGMPSGERVCTKKIGGLLQGKWLAFLGFSDDKTENLANCITTAERLGASMVWGEAVARRDPSDIAYYVLRHDQGYRAMDRYGIPEMPEKQVTLLFLYTCWTHRRLLDLNISPIFSPNRYFTPGGDNGPLRGLRVSISGFGWRPEGASMDQVPLKKGDRELVRMMVKGMGAKEVELSSGGDKPYALVVGDERPNPAKMLSAKRRDILVLKYEWLEECWTYGRLVVGIGRTPGHLGEVVCDACAEAEDDTSEADDPSSDDEERAVTRRARAATRDTAYDSATLPSAGGKN
ncbi:unnamed protein product [Vitrella brassicaformis CCMP3155]|uniref:BRCT domain-containing protein n=3 Tax=Vitrella brassicaformis TaxID=1169539 RepID=A0A0G4FBE8_VITBC|nr:unnamed protein product [Vitrella brassicaformis CCMP3155]|eukprot:CEM09944.1 unnamed protein product [Vitrella brassicaformis CCMP3155]